MRLLNVRFGHATNSSSTHSLVFLDGPVKDYLATGDFGWDHFTAASDEGKRRYMAATLFGVLAGSAPYEVVRLIVSDWTGTPLAEIPTDSFDWYVDHQSQIDIPCEYASSWPSREYARELQAYLLQKGLVILGGNNNDDEVHPLLSEGRMVEFRAPVDASRCWTCRKDPLGYWTLFSPSDGRKVRFSFDGAEVPDRATTPELVDVKITDRCEHGCDYCCQDSGPEGKHADIHELTTLAYGLGNLQVFEAAIGGGEPTSHPGLWEFIKTLGRQGVQANLSTRSLDWVRDEEKRAVVEEYCGGVAFSCDYTVPEALSHTPDSAS